MGQSLVIFSYSLPWLKRLAMGFCAFLFLHFPARSNNPSHIKTRINPIKIFLHVFPVISPWHVAVLSLACMIYIFLSDVKNMLYFMVKIFFHSILSIFFRNVEVIGRYVYNVSCCLFGSLVERESDPPLCNQCVLSQASL